MNVRRCLGGNLLEEKFDGCRLVDRGDEPMSGIGALVGFECGIGHISAKCADNGLGLCGEQVAPVPPAGQRQQAIFRGGRERLHHGAEFGHIGIGELG